MSADFGPTPLGHAFILLGATSDLAQSLTIPTLAGLAAEGQLPDDFVLVGSAFEAWSEEDFRRSCAAAGEASASPAWERLVAGFRYVAGDFTAASLPTAMRRAEPAATASSTSRPIPRSSPRWSPGSPPAG
jgi:glucose-6-phosphate 1-dehydrogenase